MASPSFLAWATIATYASLFVVSFHPAVAIPLEKRTDNTTYDYIIIGGGLTGLVAANRLTENASVNVLVVEYGYIDRTNSTTVPYYANDENTKDLYNITSAPEPYLANQTTAIPAGAVLGGGSIVNGMEFDRASAADYDSWEDLGSAGWGWSGLFPYFKKSSTFTPPPADVEAKYNFTYNKAAYGNGPLQASFPVFQYPDIYKFFAGIKALGVRFITEHALGNAVGVFWTLTALKPGKEVRSDALNAYYDPVSNRSNLHVLIGHQVTEIVFSSTLTAQGVQILSRADGSTFTAYASNEVVLAAGAVHTPHILQLSGVGPRAVLEAAGVPVKLDLVGVGNNYQDHPVGYMVYNLTNPSFPNPDSLADNATFNAISIAQYDTNRTGPYTMAHANSAAWLNIETILANASAELDAVSRQNATAYLPQAYSDNSTLLAGFLAQRKIMVEQQKAGSVAALEFPFNGGGTVANAIQKPFSRGTVYLNTTDPTAEPVITHYAMMNPFDRKTLYASVQCSRKIFNTSAVEELKPVEICPGTEYQTEESIIAALLAEDVLSPTFAHPSGSCAMMPESLGGVVGADLLVYGTRKLSIIDASIIPIIPAAHLQATMYAIGEKAADIIKSRY